LVGVGLNPSNVLGKFPHQLGGGQPQRVLTASALFLDIQILVADEMISMLDASTRIEVFNLLADLKSRALSILFIIHDLSLGYYISERAIILRRGRMVEMGDTDKMFHHPQHPYSRSLMASVPRLDREWDATDLATRQAEIEHADAPEAGRPGEPELVEGEPDHLVASAGHPSP